MDHAHGARNRHNPSSGGRSRRGRSHPRSETLLLGDDVPSEGGLKDTFESDLDRPIKCGGCACVTITAFALAAIVGIIIAAVALGFGGASSQTRVYTQSGVLRNTPYGQTLDGSGAPLAMMLPNNLEEAGFIDVTYCMTSRDAAAHVVTFEAGSLSPTFDGGFTTATFDGVAGSTFCYRAVAPDRVHVTSNFGVTLS